MITPVSRVRACVVGAGASARKHIRGWQSVADSQVVALVDVDEVRAHELAQEFGIGAVDTDYHAVLARPDINVVSLCTPSPLHGPLGIYATNLHKHAFCERGITHALDACDSLLATARGKRVAVGTCFPRRYQARFTHIRKLLDGAELGRPVVYRVHRLMPVSANAVSRKSSHDMHVFLDLFADHYDLWAWLFRSEAVRVTARGANWGGLHTGRHAERGGAPDTGAALIEYGSGDMSVITTSCGMAPGFAPGRTLEEELMGPRGVIADVQANQFVHRDEQGQERAHRFPPQDAYTEAIQDFAARIRRGEPPRVTGEDGKRALRVGLAVCESMETGKTIDL